MADQLTTVPVWFCSGCRAYFTGSKDRAKRAGWTFDPLRCKECTGKVEP